MSRLQGQRGVYTKAPGALYAVFHGCGRCNLYGEITPLEAFVTRREPPRSLQDSHGAAYHCPFDIGTSIRPSPCGGPSLSYVWRRRSGGLVDLGPPTMSRVSETPTPT